MSEKQKADCGGGGQVSSHRQWHLHATGWWIISPVPLIPLKKKRTEILGQWEGRTIHLGHQPDSFWFRSCAQCELELIRFLKIRMQSWDYLEPAVTDADL